MALFEVTEYDKKVYEEQLKDFLPDKIIDIHTHIYPDGIARKAAENRRYRDSGVKGQRHFFTPIQDQAYQGGFCRQGMITKSKASLHDETF